MGIEINDREYAQIQAFIFDAVGIALGPSKKHLVTGRLEKRLRHHHCGSYSDYLRLLSDPREAAEAQQAIDLLTTNETYFFREPKHFDLLATEAREARQEGRALRVWSAACSSGEEPYSIAMVLDDTQPGQRWEVVASDISSRVLQRARIGHYPDSRTTHIPPAYLSRYCLRGTGTQSGTLLIQRELRDRVQFMQINLDRTLPRIGVFDVVFLRNVMIYFNLETKRRVVQRLLPVLRPGGLLLIGHSESLHDISAELVPVRPSVYRRV